MNTPLIGDFGNIAVNEAMEVVEGKVAQASIPVVNIAQMDNQYKLQ